MPAWEKPASRAKATIWSSVSNGGRQSLHNSNVGQKLVGQVVALRQILGAVVGDPVFPLRVFPDQDLERQIDGDARRGQHQGGSSLGIAEDDQLGGVHLHSNFGRFPAVVDQSKDGDSLSLENRQQFFQRRVYRVPGGFVDDSVIGQGFSLVSRIASGWNPGVRI